MDEVIDKPTLKALGTETRQAILRHLSKRPYTSSELSKLLSKHVTTIGEHLDILEKSGVVKRNDSENKWVYYSLTQKGEKFFKPYYTWVFALVISLVALVTGAFEITSVQFGAASYAVQETKLATATAPLQETAINYNTNLLIGLALVIVAIVIAFYFFRKKLKVQKEKYRILMEIEKAHDYK